MAVQPSARAIDELVTQVVRAVSPLKIILFGSAARGQAGPDSDIDLLVVMPEGTHRRRQPNEYTNKYNIRRSF